MSSNKNILFQLKLCEDGPKKEKYPLSDPMDKVNDSIISNKCIKSSNKKRKSSPEKRSAMQECPANTKEWILKDKSNTSEENIQAMKSLVTLDLASTSTDVASQPFWNKSCQILSKKLLYYTRTVSVDLHSNSLKWYAKSTNARSWFQAKVMLPENNKERVNSQMTYCPLSLSLWQSIMDRALQKKEEKESNKKKQASKSQEREEEKSQTMKKEKLVKKQKATKRQREDDSEEKPAKKQKTTKLKRKDDIKATTNPNEAKIPAGKSKKIRIYPTKKQEETLKKWFGVVRWTYNQCLDAVKNKHIKRNMKHLREYCLNKTAFEKEELKKCKWVLDVPFDVRDEAMRDLLKAYKTNFAKGIKQFEVKFRSKKVAQEAIVIHSKHFKHKKGEYADVLNLMKSSEPIPCPILYDTRLIRTRLNHYYLCIPIPLEVKQIQRPENQGSLRIVSLDPGVRTFQTCYEPNGLIHEWGNRDMARIYRLCNQISKLQERWTDKETRHRKRYRLRRVANRIHFKIRNLIDEVHKKMVKWLLSNYDLVLLPDFNTQQMVRKGKRKISSKTAWAMLTWSHYRFKQRLLFKAQEYPHCKVLIVNEAYTSKTCGQCGKIHDKLGASKVFKCHSCAFTWDRDWNGARNVLLKFLTEHASQEEIESE